MLKLLIYILATFRITELLSVDSITEPLRRYLGRKAAAGNAIWRFVAELVHCPFCLGVWVAFSCSLLPGWLIYRLAIAGGQALLQYWVNNGHSTNTID